MSPNALLNNNTTDMLLFFFHCLKLHQTTPIIYTHISTYTRIFAVAEATSHTCE